MSAAPNVAPSGVYGGALIRQIAAAYDKGYRCGWQGHDHGAPDAFSAVEREAFNYGYATAVWRRDHGGALANVH
jgi:hypothetical protein